MPNIQSAKKKVRQDIKREAANSKYEETVHKLFTAKGKTDAKTKDVAKAYATIDKAAKKGIIHKNKAARLKSRISRLSSTK